MKIKKKSSKCVGCIVDTGRILRQPSEKMKEIFRAAGRTIPCL